MYFVKLCNNVHLNISVFWSVIVTADTVSGSEEET